MSAISFIDIQINDNLRFNNFYNIDRLRQYQYAYLSICRGLAFVEMEIVNKIFMNEVSLVVHYLGFKPFYDLNQAFFNYSAVNGSICTFDQFS